MKLMKIDKSTPRSIVVSANQMQFHRMIRRELHNARFILRKYEMHPSSLVGLAAKFIEDHGMARN